ncbi:uncharacterized protein N7473_007582 [Penicillium subrubescens]|uniref:uncharacterized protein n=1 Tax=Penicillium subrubescens TaxID=1316194 RepID=UPI0025452182|nr:uncharacterized protein N7473_007582 [Penicillium subrubescens]KAJ5891354.1 hypothetical protein N7473_007582 [Penicillium subrubescens]
MPARQNPLITAESLFHDLSTQLERYLRFLEIDLTPVILQSKLDCDDPSAVDLISHGEEAWLQSQGLELALPGSHVRGVWSIPTFLRNEGRSKDHNASSNLRQGRKIRRFEKELGAGIALLLAIVLPSFRRLPLILALTSEASDAGLPGPGAISS